MLSNKNSDEFKTKERKYLDMVKVSFADDVPFKLITKNESLCRLLLRIRRAIFGKHLIIQSSEVSAQEALWSPLIWSFGGK